MYSIVCKYIGKLSTLQKDSSIFYQSYKTSLQTEIDELFVRVCSNLIQSDSIIWSFLSSIDYSQISSEGVWTILLSKKLISISS